MTLNEIPDDCLVTRFEWSRHRAYTPSLKKNVLNNIILEPIFEEGWLPKDTFPADCEKKILTELGFVEYETIWKNYNTGLELTKFIRTNSLIHVINENAEIKKKYSPSTIKKELDLMNKLEMFNMYFNNLQSNHKRNIDYLSILLEVDNIKPEFRNTLTLLQDDLKKYSF